jgi:hypothetical protein
VGRLQVLVRAADQTSSAVAPPWRVRHHGTAMSGCYPIPSDCFSTVTHWPTEEKTPNGTSSILQKY